MNIVTIGIKTFIAESLGLSLGIILFYIFNIKSKRIIGMLFGSTSGLMIALMCFDVLPEALKSGRTNQVIIGMIMGVCIGLLLEDITEVTTTFSKKILGTHTSPIKSTHTAPKGSPKLKTTGIMLLIGIALHNIPEGFAIGTLALSSKDTLGKLLFIIGLHSIPEGIALAIPLKAANMKLSPLLVLAGLLGLLMGAGSASGYMLSHINENIIIIMLGLAAGVILYIVCQELLPESRKIWNGRLTAVATILGILLGMLLVS